MIKVTCRWFRPNINIAWHLDVIQTSSFVKYDNDDRRISHQSNYSEDGLELIRTMVWSNEAAWDETFTDPEVIAYRQEYTEYNESVGITTVPREIEPIVL